eukprot:scaffold5181_cov125-Isochrysis_galbana.AAC.7
MVSVGVIAAPAVSMHAVHLQRHLVALLVEGNAGDVAGLVRGSDAVGESERIGGSRHSREQAGWHSSVTGDSTSTHRPQRQSAHMHSSTSDERAALPADRE